MVHMYKLFRRLILLVLFSQLYYYYSFLLRHSCYFKFKLQYNNNTKLGFFDSIKLLREQNFGFYSNRNIFPMNAKASDVSPTSSLTTMIQQAIEYHKHGQTNDAIILYEQVIPLLVKGSLKASLSGNVGALFMQMGDYEKAKEYFLISIDSEPNNTSSHFNLAVLLTTKLEQHAKAIKHCGLAIKLDENNYKAYHLMGNILQNINRPEEAMKYFVIAENIAQQIQAQEEIKTQSQYNIDNSSSIAKIPITSMKALDKTTININNINYTIECLSESPLLFVINNLLSDDECEYIMNKASNLLQKSHIMGGDVIQQQSDSTISQTSTSHTTTSTSHTKTSTSHTKTILPNSNTISEEGDEEIVVREDEVESRDKIPSLLIDPSLYRSSFNAWLHQDDMLNTLQERLSIILNIPKAYLLHKSEELQVVKYNPGGQFKVHHDSSTFLPRMFTALIYLNDIHAEGGETWFPYALNNNNIDNNIDYNNNSNNNNIDKNSLLETNNTTPESVEEAISNALNYYETYYNLNNININHNNLNGLKIIPSKGKVIIFFNYNINGTIDPFAVHAGLPVYMKENNNNINNNINNDNNNINNNNINNDNNDKYLIDKWIANYWVEYDEKMLSSYI